MQYGDLIALTSTPRISRYLKNCRNNKQLALRAYFLNIDISGNIFKAISFLEISLRNRINNLAPMVLNLDNKSWLFDIAQGTVSTATEFRDTRKKIKEAIKLSKDRTHNQVLCQLSFGFWSSIFSGYNYLVLGSRILKHLNPNNKVDPAGLRHRLHSIRTMRNRIAHQEPVIFNLKGQFSTDQLKTLLRDIYWVQSYLYSRQLSQIAFYEQIKEDIIKLEALIKKTKTQRYEINQ